MISKHILGLLGITLLFFDLLYNLLGVFHLGILDKAIILAGILMLIIDFIPERIKVSLSKYPLLPIIDKLVHKYGSLFLCLLILIGFYLRFNNLAHSSLFGDELLTAYAAIGIMEHGSPVLPLSGVYTRSILNTGLIALSFKVFGISEFSAKLVSVIFGTLTIFLVYLMGVKVTNKRVAILAAAIITFSVWEIAWSQQCRMYAQFQFFYLFTAYLFYLGLDKTNINKASIILLFFSMIVFICAWLSHKLALTFLPVALIYILLYKREILKKQYFIYLSLSFLGLASLYMIATGKTPLDYISSSATIGAQKPFYYYALISDLNILFFLVFTSIISSILLWKLGLFKNESIHHPYLLLNFFIPFIILSLYSWKCSRYALFIFPFLVLLASQAIDFYIIRNSISKDICTQISNRFKLKKEFVETIKSTLLSILIILLVIQLSFCFVTQCPGPSHPNWKKGSEYVKGHIDEDDKIATTTAVNGLYYLGKVDYIIRQHELDIIMNNNGLYIEPRYTGAIVLNNYTFFIKTIEMSKGWMIVDYKVDMYYTDPKVREYIRNNMTYHPEGSDDTIEVYSWGIV